MRFILEDSVIKTPHLEFDEDCGGIGTMYFKAFKKYKERVAVINSKNDEFDTYSDLLQKTKSTALALQRRGFEKGDLLAICSNKENLDASVPVIAGQFLGCITFSLDPKLSVDECSELIEQVQPKIIFIIDDVRQLIEETFKKCNVQADIITFGEEFKDNFLNTDEGEACFEPLFIRNLQDTCIIHFSSGSTGAPKPICLSHYYCLGVLVSNGFASVTAAAKGQFSNHPLGPVSLRYANWYWVSTTLEMVAFIPLGGCRILQDKLNPENIGNLIEKYCITEILLSPLQCIELSQNTKPQNCNISSLIRITTGGYVLHKDYVYALRQIFPDVYIYQVYGMTETGAATSFNIKIPEHRRLLTEKPTSCGLPINGFFYKVINVDTGDKCGPNQPGELYVKSNHMFNGFYNKDSSKSFDDEGYFRTGDLVCFDEDFCFYILDRIKAILGWNDWLIYPYHIEKVLLSHPSVYNAIVIGIPHKIEGERLMGVVVLKENALKVTEKELAQYVAERVEDHKRLREGVKFVKTLPTTITGKISRLKVKEMVLKTQ